MKTISLMVYRDLPELPELLPELLRELPPDELRDDPEDDDRPLEDPLLRTLPELRELPDDEPLLYDPREEEPEELPLDRDGAV